MDDNFILLAMAAISFGFGFAAGYVWCILEKRAQSAKIEKIGGQAWFIKH